MGEKEDENKPKNYTVSVKEGIALTGAASASSISNISGSIWKGYYRLSPTFDAEQKKIDNI